MAELKTKKNKGSVIDFINTIEDDQKRKDAKELLKIFKEATGKSPVMWGSSIIGYGQYHYKSERSRQEGDWPLTGFSPRKTSLTLYIMSGVKQYAQELKNLGKHKTGVSCLYIKRLDDIDLDLLKKIIRADYELMKKKYSIA